ncbi:Uncharacterized protein LACOL_0194 [Paucilactobacillus oligofermentans DSM 15707 = LMG 22743]|uniref:hypothetical protein n=1 Tax=Paucilactobacillus oligofermentans TaxID=293371 RepID=UPI00078D258E|nr:hypothetical protein [Paucilactobacillus oligofermentans]CUS25502.1 Uncharacterized protein LACOL_0194 [Paucilactobacillus oligofermentans DSM 15707 = LMG 22743]
MKTIDIRKWLLDFAGDLVKGGPVTYEGHTYMGDEAINKGFDVIGLVQLLDLKYGKNER